MSFDIDSGAYILLAQGRWSEVMRPFANRVLAPLIVQHSGLGVDTGFLVLQLLAGAVFAGLAFWLVRKVAGDARTALKALPFLLAPWLVVAGYNIYMPDLLACALTAAFLAALAAGRRGLAVAVLPFLMMARESAIVVVGVFAVLSVWRRRWGWAVAGVAAGLLGMVLAAKASAAAQGNMNGIGSLLYMPIKAAANGVFSVTGLSPWTDVYARELPVFYTHAPLWKMACPEWARVGRFLEIGIYEWHPWQLLTTLKTLLLGFGAVIPWGIVRRRRVRPAAEWQWMACWTGLAFWLLTPISGFSPDRYLGYAWPLVWLCIAPRLAAETGGRYVAWLAAHLVVVGMGLVRACA